MSVLLRLQWFHHSADGVDDWQIALDELALGHGCLVQKLKIWWEPKLTHLNFAKLVVAEVSLDNNLPTK